MLPFVSPVECQAVVLQEMSRRGGHGVHHHNKRSQDKGRNAIVSHEAGPIPPTHLSSITNAEPLRALPARIGLVQSSHTRRFRGGGGRFGDEIVGAVCGLFRVQQQKSEHYVDESYRT
jgi:hypothetical protein